MTARVVQIVSRFGGDTSQTVGVPVESETVKMLREIRNAMNGPAEVLKVEPPWRFGTVAERFKCFIEAHPETVLAGWGTGRWSAEIGSSRKAVWDLKLYKQIHASREDEKLHRKRQAEFGEVNEC
jgi:hypothetical protein